MRLRFKHQKFQADAAKARENELRQTRKDLRASYTDLTERVEAADAQVEAAASLFQERLASLSDLTEDLEERMGDALSALYDTLTPVGDAAN